MQRSSRDQPSAESPSAPAAPGSHRRVSAEELPRCAQAVRGSSTAVDAGQDAALPRCGDTAAELELSPEPGADEHACLRGAPSAGLVEAQQPARTAHAADSAPTAGCCEPAASAGPAPAGGQHAMPSDLPEAAAAECPGQAAAVRGRELPAPTRPLQPETEPAKDRAFAGTEPGLFMWCVGA